LKKEKVWEAQKRSLYSTHHTKWNGETFSLHVT
jgi:hypothetical protein